MKKRLLTLSSLLLSILPSQGLLYAMEPVTILEKSVYLPFPTRTISMLEELRQHPRFVNACTPRQQEEQKLEEQKEQDISLELFHGDTQNNQEELNLAISQIISGSIETHDENTTNATNQTPTKAGFNWTLRLKSLTHSAADLALYTLRSNMFEHDNSDHLALLNQGILECIKDQAIDKLLTIITTTKEKHAGKIVLDDSTSQAAYNELAQAQEAQRTLFVQNFAQATTNQQINCAAVIKELQKKYEMTAAQIVEIENNVNSEYTAKKAEFRALQNKDKKAVSALRKLSNPTIQLETTPTTWDDLTQESLASSKNIELTTAALHNGKATIKDLSHYLLLDSK